MLKTNTQVQEKADKNKFIKEIKERNITKLVHYTSNINLISIFKSGAIIPRNQLECSTNINLSNSDFQDKNRYDGKDHINCSIEVPNLYSLNSKKHLLTRDDPKFFCIIAISPKYIYRESTLFSVTNAANKYNRNTIGINGSFSKFVSIFNQCISYYNSSGCYKNIKRPINIENNIPTDCQAEVLIGDNILIEDFLSVYVEDESQLLILNSVLKSNNLDNFDSKLIIADPTMFKI